MRNHNGLNNEKGEPKYTCPACKQTGLLLDASDRSPEGCCQICRICGFHYLPYIPNDSFSPIKDADRKWGEAWKDLGAEVLFDKTPEERVEYFTKLQYAFQGKYYYIPTDEECLNRTFDVELLFSQHGYLHKSDSTRKISVKCEDGRYWEFAFETNTLLYLDDPEKNFVVSEDNEQPGSGKPARIYLCVSEYLSKLSSGERQYRGFEIGIFPEAFGGVYSLDDECVLVGLDKKKYCFDIVK